MGRKLAQSLLLIVVIAALMIGGDMVQEGRREMRHVDPDVTVAYKQDGATGIIGTGIDLVADVSTDEMFISTDSCPHAHRDF